MLTTARKQDAPDWTTLELLHIEVEFGVIPRRKLTAERLLSRGAALNVERVISELELSSFDDAANLRAQFGMD